MSLEQYMNTELLPMDIDDYPWLYEKIDEEVKQETNPLDVGKWMLFFNTKNLNKNWELAKKIIRERKIDGITSMKCSTNYDNVRSSNNKEGVIILYCNESSNESRIMEIGRKILFLFNYTEKRMVFYKTDLQTWEGTGATGVKKNYTYKLFNKLYNNNACFV